MTELPRYLRVARALALATTTSACGAATEVKPVVATPVAPVTPAPATSGTTEPESIVTGDPTTGTGPCRCSWDAKADSAPRVCKKGESAYDGKVCVPGRKKYPIMVGPLPPPDLPLA